VPRNNPSKEADMAKTDPVEQQTDPVEQETNADPITGTNAADKGPSSAAAVEEDRDTSAAIEIGTVDDADEYTIDQSHLDGGADDDLQKVFAGRPSEDYYWRTHPDKDNEWKLAWTITFEDVTYLVHPKVAEVKRMSERKIRPLLHVRCVNVKGREQIWSLKLDRPGKKRNETNASALMVAERMRDEWLMLVYDDETKTYFGRRPETPITDAPRWTGRTFKQLLDLAYPEDQRINTLDHWVWRKLASGK
jgi:hypothetical protein